MLQRQAFHELHGKVAEPVRFPEIMGSQDVRVRDAAREPDLLLEPVEEGRVGGKDFAAQGLDRDEIVELPVVRLVDDAHPTLAENRLDVIAAGEESADLRLVGGGRSGRRGRRGASGEQGLFTAERDRQRRDVLFERRFLFQLLEHGPEGARENPDLVVRLDRDLGLEISDPHRLGRANQPIHRPGDPPREHE